MMNFLKNVDAYFRDRPWLFFTLFATLLLFFITTVVLSVVCPPAVLAIGFGAWSLIGNILPLVGIGLFNLFGLCSIAAQIPRLCRSPIDDLVEGLREMPSQMAVVNTIRSSAAQNLKQSSGKYTSLFAKEEGEQQNAGSGLDCKIKFNVQRKP